MLKELTKNMCKFRMELRMRYDWAIMFLIGALAGILVTITISFQYCTRRIVRSHTVT